jgi:hypothetical protein
VFQVYDVAPLAVSVAEEPVQIVCEAAGAIAIVGLADTTTTCVAEATGTKPFNATLRIE